MTRIYAVKQVLKHGPMTRHELIETMGGNAYTARKALFSLVARGEVVRLPSVSCKPVYQTVGAK